jgi:hypothetical protein
LALASLAGGGRSVGLDPHGLLRQGLLLLLYALLSTVKLFGKQQGIDVLLDTQPRNDATRHSEHVENRVILRRFTDANEEFPFRDHDEASTSLKKANFVEYLSVLKNHGPLLKHLLNSAIGTRI